MILQPLPVHTHESAGDGGLIQRLGRMPRTGIYWGAPQAGNVATLALTAATMYASQLMLVRPMTFDRLAIEITVAAGAGNSARLGIYADGTNAYPGALVVDVGTVAIDSAAIVAATITGNQALSAGRYWLAILPQANITIRGAQDPTLELGFRATDFSTQEGCWQVAQAYGALPATFTAGGTMLGRSCLVKARVLSLD